ncbi:unnamed protein product [marine sediment metagenome]|uniref:Uncharacterized protein n=1 Tax=marine sediment metagenome TaxID=412755 RepID=X1U104_9ZZZZ
MSVEESLEFQKALTEACEKQYRGYLFGGAYKKAASKDKIGETLEKIEAERKRLMEKHEGYMKQAELAKQQARFMTDPAMREIMENLRKKHDSGGLVCPVCGEGDHGNKMNGKPICYMNSKHKAKGVNGPVPLMTPEKAKDWKPPAKKPKFKEQWELDEDEIVKVRGSKKRHK